MKLMLILFFSLFGVVLLTLFFINYKKIPAIHEEVENQFQRVLDVHWFYCFLFISHFYYSENICTCNQSYF